jgi:hypothetical protein
LNFSTKEKMMTTFLDQALDVCEGNPGAISVLARFMRDDPQVVAVIIHLGLRGSAIWMLWKDEAKEDEGRFVEILNERWIQVHAIGAVNASGETA